MALIVVACIVIMGTAFGVKYISSLDIEQEIVEAPVQQEIPQQQESVQQEPVQDLQVQKETVQVTQVQQDIPEQQSKDLLADGKLNNWLIRLMISAACIAIGIRTAIKMINTTRGD